MPPSEIKRFEILGKGVPVRIGVAFWSESRTKTDSNCGDSSTIEGSPSCLDHYVKTKEVVSQ